MKKYAKALAGGVLAAATLATTLGIAASANAAPLPTATATTHLTQRPDSGDAGNTWALDNLERTVSVTLVGPSATPGMYDFTGTITDTGTAAAITGATSPGTSAIPVQGSPVAKVQGSGTYTFQASTDTVNASLVPKSIAEGGALPTGDEVTSDWPEYFFSNTTTFADVNLANWSWTYTDSRDCQTWIDAETYPAGTVQGDITGVDQCVTPPTVILSDGMSHAVSPTREDYSWVQNTPTWDKLTITGPGFNHQVGWVSPKNVNGKKTGFYTGLRSGHTYVVELQPYSAKNGTLLPSTAGNRVTFVTIK